MGIAARGRCSSPPVELVDTTCSRVRATAARPEWCLLIIIIVEGLFLGSLKPFNYCNKKVIFISIYFGQLSIYSIVFNIKTVLSNK